jgi:RNA polymerase sigma-70 factor (ECF subfamily)
MDQGDEIDALLQAVAQGDADAFRRLYDLTSARLMAVVWRICRAHAASEDVLQEVYVQVWRRAASFDPGRGPGIAWMIVIARHRAIDHVRASGRTAASGSAQDDLVLENLAAPAHDAERSDDLRALLRCLRRLDDRHARAILLAYYDGLSRAELAERFEIPENTIKTWLRRGLIALRQCMGDA